VPPRWQPSLEDYIDLAAYLLDTEHAGVARLPRIALAESALHAPFASFGCTEAYPTLVEQAAVLLQHLARNHPLPDANKRAAFLLTARFLDANGLTVGPAGCRDGRWPRRARRRRRCDPRSGRRMDSRTAPANEEMSGHHLLNH
jgi:death on curing protein